MIDGAQGGRSAAAMWRPYPTCREAKPGFLDFLSCGRLSRETLDEIVERHIYIYIYIYIRQAPRDTFLVCKEATGSHRRAIKCRPRARRFVSARAERALCLRAGLFSFESCLCAEKVPV